MRTFGELLTEYMRRTGISDSELARTLGVRRQTIFRWKEGLVARPRSREDVLLCAQRLRLSLQERDELLISAGFAPEALPLAEPKPVEEEAASPELAPPTNEQNEAQISAKSAVTPNLLVPEQAPESALTPVTLNVTPVQAENVALPDLQAKQLPVAGRRFAPRAPFALVILAALAVLVLVAGAIFITRDRLLSASDGLPRAAAGETLIVLGQFTATTPGQPDYDVTGRVQGALEREIQASRLGNVRVARLTQDIRDDTAAAAIRQRSGAALVIWGRQTNGQVTAQLDFGASPAQGTGPLGSLVSLPGQGKFSINSALPEELRALALLTVAHLYLQQQNLVEARAELVQALSQPPVSHDAAALLNLDLGYVEQASTPPDGDRALASYAQAIDLAPELTAAYLNRGVIYLRQSQAQAWQDDFMRVLTLEPNGIGARRALCWGYALDTRPELALPHCSEAVAHDSTALSRDARGVVYAELGRTQDAIADFQAFVDWLGKQPQSMRDRYLPTRTAWVQVLQANKNPIDQTVLAGLRQE